MRVSASTSRMIISAMLLSIGSAGAQTVDRGAIFEANKQAVVRVTVTGRNASGQPVERRRGTGVMVRASGRILTSLNLVGRDEDWAEQPGGRRERFIDVSAPDGQGVERPLGRAVVTMVPARDVVMLNITGENFREAAIELTPPSSQSSVVALIWEPDAGRAEPVTGDLVPTDSGRYGDVITIRMPSLEGSEGAGVFNALGKLVGIISKRIDATRALAEPVHAFYPFLPPPTRAQRSSAEVAICESELRNSRAARQPFRVSNSVRCENMGDSRRGIAVYRAPPNFVIVDQVSKADQTNYGEVGPIVYGKDGDRVVHVSAELRCETPNRPFGPGGWSGTTLMGSIERVLSRDELVQIHEECLNR